MLLKGKKVAILTENFYHELELFVPYYRLIEEGAIVDIIGINREIIYKGKLANYPINVNMDIKEISAKDYDGVIIPGGYSPENLRVNEDILHFVKEMNTQDKTVAAICHAGWVISSAEIIKNRNVTSHPYIKHDLVNAGGIFIDEPVVVDHNLITSRLPKDLPFFCKEIIKNLSEFAIQKVVY